MIYQIAVILTDVEYKCEFCILSPGQVVSDKFMEIDLAISAQKFLGNGGLLNDSDTTRVRTPPGNLEYSWIFIWNFSGPGKPGEMMLFFEI